MATRPERSIPQRLNDARVAIDNTLAETEIQGLVAEYGYTAQKMTAGQTLLTTAAAKVDAQQDAAGAQKQATADLKAAEKEARDAFEALAKVARAINTPNLSLVTTLDLNRPTPRSTAGFIAAANTLFNNAQNNPAVSAELAKYGYTAEKLQTECGKIAAYSLTNEKQEAAKGAAQQATQEQDAALAALDNWVAQYVKIARVALRGKKQLLEKLGIAARTTKTAAQRAGAAKAAATRAAKKQAKST